ncbi:phage tail tube protein [Pararhizobium sp. DWP3-4]|uniref:phage tail tube protein n=1 Tax=Pararhizobium sp. DWP3-4 TaxID=2804565 RepID=UPI003CF3F1CE
MAEGTTIKGGKVKVQLGSGTAPIVYASPCGLTQRSITFNKGLEEFQLPDCDDPDSIDWLGRDATSLSMAIAGETILAEESVEVWLDAWESIDSVPVKVIWEFPAKTITWTGKMHVENLETTAPNARRVTGSVSMQSDGKMTRVVA